jgi:hypothetical protein
MRLKNFFKKIISDGYDITDYVPVGVLKTEAKVFFEIDQERVTEVTDRHFTLAYNPLIVGIVLPVNWCANLPGTMSLHFVNGTFEHKHSILYLKYFKVVFSGENHPAELVLFRATGASNYQLDWLRRSAILAWRYVQNKIAGKYFGTLSFALYKQYAAVFSFPRKVGLITVMREGSFKSFPVDLHGKVEGTNQYVWGIRHSNSAIQSILTTKKVVISTMPYTSYRSVYSLGKFGTSDETPAGTPVATETWSYQLPGFISGYLEIELIHSEDIGSQRFFCGTIIFEKQFSEGRNLHHIHLLQFLQMRDQYITVQEWGRK